uniref:PKD_channel domain-containing protein n=1 Tax=Echinostoma caproni TaxID=27848 RepID=A0A183B8D4_9TREM
LHRFFILGLRESATRYLTNKTLTVYTKLFRCFYFLLFFCLHQQILVKWCKSSKIIICFLLDICNVYGKMRSIVKNCYATYDIFTQDEQSYGVGWVPFEGTNKKNNSSPEFAYTNQHDLDGIPFKGEVTWYSGGGYVFMLRGTEASMLDRFNYLDENHWIDFSTRAIIVQFTTFNPNINLFAIITALIEKPGVGSLITSYRIETANLFGSAATEAGKLEMDKFFGSPACISPFIRQIAFVLVLVGYVIKELRNIYRQRCTYFKMFWSYMEWFILIGSFASIAAYVYMIVATKDAIDEFSRTHGNVFMNFQFLAYWNEALTYLTALVCFASTLKLVRLFRFNQRIGLLGSVLSYASKDMKYFMIVFLVMFSAFVLVFYLLYTDTLEGFRSILGSTETCMQIILGKFDFTSMYEREMVLGPMLFALFNLCVIFVMVSMFVAILDDSFHRVLEDLKLQSDEHEITQFIFSQLIQWTGLSRTNWGKRLVADAQGVIEPTYMEDSERELNMKLNELTQMMDEFLSYVQINQLAGTK